MRSKYPVLLVVGLSGLVTFVDLASAQSWAIIGAPWGHWNSVASSADGTKLVAAGGGYPCRFDCGLELFPIYTSADSGVTWTPTSTPNNTWSSAACSADGTKLVAAASGLGGDGLIYTSPDSGASWMPINLAVPGYPVVAVASSADGGKLVAATAIGAIYTLQFPPLPSRPPPSPRLAVSPSGGSLDISWLVPSTSFVLQQSVDLGATNWTAVPTVPTLNFTNLNYLLRVSPSLSQRFYRLKQQ